MFVGVRSKDKGYKNNSNSSSIEDLNKVTNNDTQPKKVSNLLKYL